MFPGVNLSKIVQKYFPIVHNKGSPEEGGVGQGPARIALEHFFLAIFWSKGGGVSLARIGWSTFFWKIQKYNFFGVLKLLQKLAKMWKKCSMTARIRGRGGGHPKSGQCQDLRCFFFAGASLRVHV